MSADKEEWIRNLCNRYLSEEHTMTEARDIVDRLSKAVLAALDSIPLYEDADVVIEPLYEELSNCRPGR